MRRVGRPFRGDLEWQGWGRCEGGKRGGKGNGERVVWTCVRMGSLGDC